MKPQWVQKLMARYVGMVDSPLLTGISLHQAAKKLSIPYASLEVIAKLSADEKSRAVILVQDAFTSYFETQVVIDILTALKKLNFVPLLAPFKPNGKALHVHGFLNAFAKAADVNATYLNGLASAKIPMIGVDPAMTLTYRFEYKKILGDTAPKVLLIQEWLAKQSAHLQQFASTIKTDEFILLAHCTEKTNALSSIKEWQQVFSVLGNKLSVMETGCCGMSGTFGHEAANLETSKTIFALSWQKIVQNPANTNRLTATGYSCRSQVKRLEKRQLPHPLQILLRQLSE
jgi:Fe-S oxidoreductase